MKKIFLVFVIAVLFACNNEGDTKTTKGNTDATDSTTVRKDNTINRDTDIHVDADTARSK